MGIGADWGVRPFADGRDVLSCRPLYPLLPLPLPLVALVPFEGEDMPARATVCAIPPKSELFGPEGWALPRCPSEFLE